jgi:hypothetical protein
MAGWCADFRTSLSSRIVRPTPELSAERTASDMNFRKLHEREAVEASRPNDLLDCADDVKTGCEIRLTFSPDK